MLAAGGIEYLVDAIALHDHLHTLRDTFADPKIIKVTPGRLPPSCVTANMSCKQFCLANRSR